MSHKIFETKIKRDEGEVSASGIGLAIFIGDSTHEGSSRINSEVNRTIQSANLQRNAYSQIRRNFVM